MARVLSPKLLAVLRAKLAQGGAVCLRGEHVARAVDEVVRLVHQQRHVAALQKYALNARYRVKGVVVIAHDDVRDLRKRKGELEGADAVLPGGFLDCLAIPKLPAHQRFYRLRQTDVKALRHRAVFRVAAPLRAQRADLLLGGQLQRAHAGAALCKAAQGRERQRAARRARGEIKDLVRMARRQRLERGKERGRGLPRTGGRLREQPPALADGDEHIPRKGALARAKAVVREGKGGERRISLPSPGKEHALPSGVGLDQR